MHPANICCRTAQCAIILTIFILISLIPTPLLAEATVGKSLIAAENAGENGFFFDYPMAGANSSLAFPNLSSRPAPLDHSEPGTITETDTDQNNYHFTALSVFVEQPETPVDFPDANLEAAVRDALGKPAGNITRGDMAEITSLDASKREITDLNGLEYAVTLDWLNLNDNQLADVTPLPSSGNLRYLYLGNNQLTQSIFEQLIQRFPQLRGFGFGGNGVSDISALSNLPSLRYLYLAKSQINDVSALAGLTYLRELNLSNNLISNLTGLTNLIYLEKLWMHNNQLTDIAPLAKLAILRILGLGSNQLSNVAVLEKLANLEDVGLWENKLTAISPLEGLTSMQYLYLDHNQISDITALADLDSLQKLDLSSNQIVDISALSGLNNLTWLRLRTNQITNISPLSGIVSLRYLSLDSNRISAINALTNLINLYGVSLSNNQITNISPLVTNSINFGLGMGDFVFLDNNYLDLSVGSQALADLQTLQQQGVFIIFEPQLKPVMTLASVAIDNSVNARPQAGLDQAAIIYETAVAPGITRFLAIYDLANPVNKIGPVRSAREHLVGLVAGHGGGFAHAGGDSISLALLPQVPVVNLDEIYGSGNYFNRTVDRPMPHNLYTSTGLLQQGLTASDRPLAPPVDPLPRGEMAGGTIALTSTARFPDQGHDVLFQWDAAGQHYRRSENGQPVLLENSAPITAANVIVLYTDHRREYQKGLDEWTIKARVEGSGDALFFRNGKVWAGQWSKTDRDAMFAFSVAGSPMQFAPGNVWVLIVPLPGQQTIIIPDPGLNAAVREALDKPQWDLTTIDLDLLTYLDASGRGIQDLTGLDRAVNIHYLDLRDNDISDISPLLGTMSPGTTTDLRFNYLDLAPASEDMDGIETLINSGVTVQYRPQLGSINGRLQLQAQ